LPYFVESICLHDKNMSNKNQFVVNLIKILNIKKSLKHKPQTLSLGKSQGEVQVLFHLFKNAQKSSEMIFTWHKRDDVWKILKFQGVR
jgi:ABC-type lipoprotein export system ATPase subunit